MPELIQQEKTGFLVKDIQEAVVAVQQIKQIERSCCREWSVFQFSQDKMAAGYLRLYEHILKGTGCVS